jgi:Sec-independent protein secretion pathway component TatC
VFGVPVACVLLNLISGFTVSQKENAKPYMYYIMAVVAFVATGIMIYLGMK